MRQVVLDTETTGLEVSKGHRVIEIGCVEIQNRRRTDNKFHVYINPERDIDEAAEEVHGISRAMLADKPVFTDILESFVDFVTGAELVIHNADFDTGFIDREIELAGSAMRISDCCSVIDTLTLARQMHPGQRNSLDALCRRYQIDNSGRDLHGALLDAELLADVYLAMTGGQVSLSLQTEATDSEAGSAASVPVERDGLTLNVRRASEDERALHAKYLERLDASCAAGAAWPRSS